MRPVIAVAAGCLRHPDGQVLIAQRPEGKIAAGQWEFPGGKIEPGESAHAALVRELHEELGVEVRAARPLIRVRHDYSDRTVVLDTWLVSDWAGQPQGRERQAFAWVHPERLQDYPLLAADGPIVTALQLPGDYVFTPPDDEPTLAAAALASLPRGSLLRLRWPALDGQAYRAAAARLLPLARAQGLRVILDRDPEDALALGADGWHATEAQLRQLRSRPAKAPALCLASTHSLEALQRARALGFDAAVLGPVQATRSHPDRRPLGWTQFGEWVAAAGLPVYALGGVGPAAQVQAQAVYAQGICGISAYWR